MSLEMFGMFVRVDCEEVISGRNYELNPSVVEKLETQKERNNEECLNHVARS